MSQPYGPAIVLGVMIGGAVLIDDHLTPPVDCMMAEHTVELRRGVPDGTSAAPGPAVAGMKRHKVVMALDSGHDHSAHGVVDVVVTTDDNGLDIDLPAVVGAAIAKAEAEGRELTPQELAAALDEALGDTAVQDIDINIELETAP